MLLQEFNIGAPRSGHEMTGKSRQLAQVTRMFKIVQLWPESADSQLNSSHSLFVRVTRFYRSLTLWITQLLNRTIDIANNYNVTCHHVYLIVARVTLTLDRVMSVSHELGKVHHPWQQAPSRKLITLSKLSEYLLHFKCDALLNVYSYYILKSFEVRNLKNRGASVAMSYLLDVTSEAKSWTLLGDHKNGLLFAQIESSSSPFLTAMQRQLETSPNVESVKIFSKHTRLYFVKPELIIHFVLKYSVVELTNLIHQCLITKEMDRIFMQRSTESVD